MENVTKENLADRNIWLRFLYMAILVVAYAVAETVIVVVSIFQFLCALITGKVNQGLHRFGANLTAYIAEIFRFATFNSDELPFPFTDWPNVETGDTPWSYKAAETHVEAPVAEVPGENDAPNSDPQVEDTLPSSDPMDAPAAAAKDAGADDQGPQATDSDPRV